MTPTPYPNDTYRVQRPGRTLRRVFRLAAPFWRGMLLAMILSAITIASSVALMGSSAWMISKAALQLGIETLHVAPVMVRGFGISRAVFRYLERLVSHDVTFRLLARLRVWFYGAVEPLAPARLAEYRSGDLLGRVVADVEELENIFLRVIAPPVVALIIATGVTIFFGIFDPLLAVVVLAFFVAAGTGLPLLAWVTGQGPGRDMVAARAELNAALVDNIQGLQDAVAYGQQDRLLADLDRENQRLARRERRMAMLDGVQTGGMVALTHLAAVAVLYTAIGRVDPIMLGTFTLMTVAAFEALTPLVPAAHHLGASLAAAERLYEIVDTQPAITDPVDPAPRPDSVALRVEDLTFRYAPDDPPALDGLSFELAPGRMVAIVGPSGAGKSTLANILLRFYDYERGQVTIGGRDLRDYAQDDVHALYGVMSQRTHLFNTTIRENVRIARDGAADDEVIAAAQRAQIHDFITALPQGYLTYVGEGGAALSGGERQRVALARMLLKDAPVLLLDEPTANLDAVTEQAVLKAIYDARGGRSLLVITHRLTLLDRADEIIVLDEGRVAERGTHAELLERDGLYRRLYDIQHRIIEASQTPEAAD
ncbi:MAG: thiol reductant ABC exporter subunit CydC [Chloroflexota bacterium]